MDDADRFTHAGFVLMVFVEVGQMVPIGTPLALLLRA